MAAGASCGGDLAKGHLEQVLTNSWRSYRQHFITPEGQVRVPEEGGGTISEAQAYSLLRAVWAGDEATFGRVYAWTYRHLSRQKAQGDSLLAWRWGKKPDGIFGVLDANTATDADLDYALALVLAARKGWRPPPDCPPHLEEGRRVQEDILKNEVVSLPSGELLLTPGNWHESKPPYLINPSYFSPGAYQLFGQVFPDQKRLQNRHPSLSPLREGWSRGNPKSGSLPSWGRLRQDTYPLLDQLNHGLGAETGVGLFPDWCQVDAQGKVRPAPGKDTRFGWEAVRLPFRLALDDLWFGNRPAARLLGERFLLFFKKEWQVHGRLVAVYNYDGTPAVDYESPVLYAGVLAAALTAGDQDFARQMAAKILSFYREQGGRTYFEAPDNYYANNWAWLGLALYAGRVRP